MVLTVLNPPGSCLVPSVLLRSWLVRVCIWASRLLSMIGPPVPMLGCCISWVCCMSCCCRSCSCCNCCCWALRLVGPCKNDRSILLQDSLDFSLLHELVLLYYMSLVVRKPVIGVSDQVPHKPGCTAT